ncbi:MAG: YigZ family protein [Clostridia bacterium]|nr:YigZ family protein [Clostridia bacterium]
MGEKLNDSFTTLAGNARVEFEEKKSVFIGHAIRTDSEEEALTFVKKIKKEYNDATHNVFAYTINKGIIARYSDDGEPQGTSGMPTLDAIRKSGVDNACVVITRYFGGTLLGAGGLVRAYSHTASLALEAAGIVTYEPYSEYELKCGYSEYQKYSAYFGDIGAVIDDTVFEADVTVRFAVKRREADGVLKKISEMSYGKDMPMLLGERYDYR